MNSFRKLSVILTVLLANTAEAQFDHRPTFSQIQCTLTDDMQIPLNAMTTIPLEESGGFADFTIQRDELSLRVIKLGSLARVSDGSGVYLFNFDAQGQSNSWVRLISTPYGITCKLLR